MDIDPKLSESILNSKMKRYYHQTMENELNILNEDKKNNKFEQSTLKSNVMMMTGLNNRANPSQAKRNQDKIREFMNKKYQSDEIIDEDIPNVIERNGDDNKADSDL